MNVNVHDVLRWAILFSEENMNLQPIIRTISQPLFAILLSLPALAQQLAPSIPSTGFGGLDQYRASRISIYTDDFGPSKPTTETSGGRRRPRADAACIAPIAMLSLKAKIAEGGSGRLSSRSAASWPPWTRKFECWMSWESGRTPPAARTAR